MAPTEPAAPLQLLIDFVNTRDIEDDTDAISEPSALRAWLHDRGLLTADEAVRPADVRRAAELREALRAVLLAHHGDAADPSKAAAVLESVPLTLRVGPDGGVDLRPQESGVAGALGQIVAAIPAAAAEGSWDRAKVCPDDTCAVAFYDTSRNRSRRWCSMEVCGNRQKSRTFRQRQAAD